MNMDLDISVGIYYVTDRSSGICLIDNIIVISSICYRKTREENITCCLVFGSNWGDTSYIVKSDRAVIKSRTEFIKIKCILIGSHIYRIIDSGSVISSKILMKCEMELLTVSNIYKFLVSALINIVPLTTLISKMTC